MGTREKQTKFSAGKKARQKAHFEVENKATFELMQVRSITILLLWHILNKMKKGENTTATKKQKAFWLHGPFTLKRKEKS